MSKAIFHPTNHLSSVIGASWKHEHNFVFKFEAVQHGKKHGNNVAERNLEP